MNALESGRVRLVSRAIQRGIGEALIEGAEKPRAQSLYGFADRYPDPQLRRWLTPVLELLGKSQHTTNRQRILLHGVVVHAMLDTLDPEHKVTRKRPGWGNKLSRRSRKELESRVFPVYLPFVTRPHAYTRPPEEE